MKLRPWRQWTVRVRIVLSVVALAGLALFAADGIGVVLVDRYLVNRVDDQLKLGLGPRFPPGQARPGAEPSTGSSAPGGSTGAQPLPTPTSTGVPRISRDFRPGPNSQVFLYGSDGRLTYTIPEPAELDAALIGDVAQRAQSDHPFTVDAPDGRWRVRASGAYDGGYVVRAVSLNEASDTRDKVLLFTGGASLLLLLFVGAATATLVRLGLAPLTRMEETAVEIAGGKLSSRVVDADPHTESGRLGIALNTMLTRIEEAVEDSAASERRLRQFLADAAHELRTPLTSVQGFAELYRRGGAPPGPALDEAMECIEAEVSRMRLLVNDLLTLARMDEERSLQRHPVDLLAVAADSVRDAHVRVPTRFVQLATLDERSVTFEPVTAEGDEARLRQVVANLVSNALQHTPEDTRVVVRVGRPDKPKMMPIASVGAVIPEGVPLAAVEVADTGPGMKPEDAVRVFERLYRAEGSRSRRYGGAGLGLSIVAAIVQAHGGRVELWTAPGQGATFRVVLPAMDLPDFDDEADVGDELEQPRADRRPDEPYETDGPGETDRPGETRATGFRGNSEVR